MTRKDVDKSIVPFSVFGVWLAQAVARALVKIEGNGHKTDPYRYWTLEAEARWREDPLYEMRQQMEKARKATLEAMRPKWAKKRAEPPQEPADEEE